MSLYLITGGAGFIGSNIVKELICRGEKVRVLDNFSTGKRENLFEFNNYSNYELVEGDIRSFHIVRDSVKGVDYILHQGALPSVPRSVNDPITTNEVNITGTLNVLEAAREFQIKRVVFASSSSIYGNSEVLPKDENMPVAPLSPYALTKYAGERYCQIFYKLYGIETVALRYFNVFGPNQDPTSQYSAVIPKFIKLFREEKQPVIYGDGLQSRDFTYVSNNVEANLLACIVPEIGGQVFNIACGTRYTLIDLVNALNKLLNKNIQPEFEPSRLGDVKHSLASIEKARQKLNFNVNTGFSEGLEKLIKHSDF
jgi:nucleoside-diphosphate-sugar epimerase